MGKPGKVGGGGKGSGGELRAAGGVKKRDGKHGAASAGVSGGHTCFCELSSHISLMYLSEP
jgi:hypothetical protein